jgi:hypothetical protein
MGDILYACEQGVDMAVKPRIAQMFFRAAGVLALCAAQAAMAGVQIDIVQSSVTSHAGLADRRGHANASLRIDGPRFQIASAHEVETSLDDGATTRFRAPSAAAQTPLDPATPTALDPIAASIEDEKVTIGPSVAGAPWNGHPTRRYSVDIDYTTVARLALLITRRFPTHEHYELTVADLDASPAALRVMLTRGYARSLALHPAAWSGFPVRIDARLRSEPAAAGATPQTTALTIEATSIAPWAWYDADD